MKYYDISLNLSADTVRWVTSPPFELRERRREVEPGRYELICFPVRIRGSDAAPCRAVLRDIKE